MRVRHGAVAVALALTMLGLAACGSSKTSSSATTAGHSSGPTTPAPTGTTLVIGQLEDQTGPGVSGTNTVGQDVLTAWVKWTNAHGGLVGHPVKLITMNDNADPAQAQTDLNTMINDDHIIALVGQDAEDTEPTWDTLMLNARIPVIGGPGYTTAWFTNPMFYPSTTTVPSNVWGEIYSAKNAGGTKLASLLCNNATVCLGAVPLFTAAAKELGLPVVYNETASETATDYTAECLAMKSSGADTVIAFVNDQLLAENCQAQGYHPIWVGANTSITLAQLKATPALNGLTGPSNSFPWWQQFASTSEYFQAMQAYEPAYLSGGSKESLMTSVGPAVFAGGVVFGNAIKNAAIPAGQAVTAEDVIKGLSMIQKSNNGGFTPLVSYGNGTTPSAQVACFWIYKVTNSQYVSVNGDNTSCEPLTDLGVKGGTA